MGDRALITVTDGKEFSPTCYLHWHGVDVPYILNDLHVLMENRRGDVSYTFARLVGICHELISGNMSLGVLHSSSAKWDKESHGDAGAILYNCATGEVQLYDSYLGDDDWENLEVIEDIGDITEA